MPDSASINQASNHFMTPELQWVVALCHRTIERDEIIWQWRRSTVVSVLSVVKLIKSSHAVWSLILGPGPDQAYCCCLSTYHLLSASSKLWQEGFQEQLWSVSACHSALVTPGEGSPLWARDVPELGWNLNGRAHGCRTMSSVWYRRRLGVSRQTLVCATCLTPDTVMTQPAVPYSFISLMWAHDSIRKDVLTAADTYAFNNDSTDFPGKTS